MFGKRVSLFQFFPKTIETKGIIGDLVEKPKIESITVYPTYMKCISCISHCEAETVLICNNSEDILKKEDLNYNKYQTLKTLQDIRVMDISQTKDGHAILSVAIVEDPDNEGEKLGIVLVLDEEGNTTCAFDKRKIVNDSENDYIPGYYDDSFDEDEEVDMFDYPSRVLNTKKDDILIIDNSNLSTYAGKVVLLNRSGDIVREYNGCECENCNDVEFCPFDIAETHSNLILISDIGKHSIHVLGETLLTCSFVDDIGIDYPLSLCIDAAGKLWIGCDLSADDDEEPKIYCITFN
ncbi:unnamed protein product [Mytilus edulis]|uniref:Uncharacterized protein n=1 Tax=Mytilus edulis TaxID=6550 RepID=A0A8S3VP39_MYTED|nr:unnamed protein product [Mytilus edulis]